MTADSSFQYFRINGYDCAVAVVADYIYVSLI